MESTKMYDLQKSRIRFAKMEGLGNDYIYLESFATPMAGLGKLAVAMSDRHFGVGGDGIVLIGSSRKADFSMRMFNADGSEGEMCGNAIRCVGKYVYDRGMTRKTTVTIETLAGIRSLKLSLSGYCVSSVRVDMGRPVFDASAIPIKAQGKDFIDQEIRVAGKTYRATGVSMGNPHLVVPVSNVDDLDLAGIGPRFENHELFPNRINTEFVQVLNKKEVRMRVWERGSGETLACGTGACATVAACVVAGLTDRRVVVHLSGGDLLAEWSEQGEMYMTGPAKLVSDGEYVVPAGLLEA